MTENKKCALIISIMAKTKKSAKKTVKRVTKHKVKTVENDSTYFLKIVFFFLLGTFWVRLLHINIGPYQHISLPAGLVIGIVLASRENFQIDRKIEFAVLLAATFISFYLPVGITV